jgi:hypothetical protein
MARLQAPLLLIASLLVGTILDGQPVPPAPAGQGPPSVMHWCSQHCGTMTLDPGPPFDKPHYGSVVMGSIATVKSFTHDQVVMERTAHRIFIHYTVTNRTSLPL